ncbi:MAG TPA: AEC family transporter, partial [Burkholderiaceae bacterium]|nr:AEC family transporter [Burkholderiaceae bacterium]
MLAIFLVTFPFFALIAAGYAAARGRILPLEAIPGLNAFVLYFALPCMLYRFGADTPIAQLLDGPVALVWGVAAFIVVGLAVWLARRGGLGWNDAAFGALVAAFPNTGFMGVPLLAAILGASAAGPVIITIAF